MKRSLMFAGGVAALALAAAFLWSQHEPAEVTLADVELQAREQQQAREGGTEQESLPKLVAPHPSDPTAASTPDTAALDEDEFSEDPVKMFRADAAEKLVLNERTRLNIEKLNALYTADERQQRLATIEQTLPAQAYQQLVDLLERHDNVTRDAKQALPPGREPSTVEEAITHYETLHALRVAHFGAEAAEAMYGNEERIGRQLLNFMALEKHEGLTMEEKADRAQEMLLRSPDLLAAYAKNRTEAAEQKK